MLNKKFLGFLLLSLTLVLGNSPVMAASDEAAGEEEFDFGHMIIHHVLDAYEWHFFDSKALGINGTVYLPVIGYTSETGLDIFSSRHLATSHNLSAEEEIHTGDVMEKSIEESAHNDHEAASATYQGYYLDHKGNLHHHSGATVIDLSITKVVATMLLGAGLLLLIFLMIARTYKKQGVGTPRGFQSAMEPIIVFIRDEVARPALGHKAPRYLPYLLTLFFFIWIFNMIGLMPFLSSPNVTGNIAITATLAALTFLITNLSANKHYWKHIFWPDMPKYLLPIWILVEIMGLIIKPLALCIRLFANITAGHMIVLAIIGLIFVFGQINAGLGFGMSLVSMAFALFMFFLELLVAAVQAYIFTMLTAVFMGQAVEEAHH